MTKGDELVQLLLEHPGNDTAANELLREFFHGFPIDRLLPLITSDNEEVVKVGAWLGSELGVMFRPLFSHASTLLNRPSRYVRFFAIDCVLTCATEADADEVASVLGFLKDPDSGVRWKALDFLTRAAEFQLRGALERLSNLDVRLGSGLAWLLSQPDAADVRSKIDSSDEVLRKFGVAAAVRSGTREELVLRAARDSKDEDVAGFATDGFSA